MSEQHTRVLSALCLMVALLGAPMLIHSQPAYAVPPPPPSDPQEKIACLLAKPATADTDQVTSFGTNSRQPGQALIMTVQISGVSTIVNVVVSDDAGVTWKKLALNGTTGALAVGKWYSFTGEIMDQDQDGDALIYNVHTDDTTTIDYLTLHRAKVGSP